MPTVEAMPAIRATSSKSSDPIELRLHRVRRRRTVRSLALPLVVTVAAVYVLFGVVFCVAVVEGPSMSPALEEGDVVIFQRAGASYQAGDIVLVRADDGTGQVKRITATPGQSIGFDGLTGDVVVDDEVLLEPYVYEETYATWSAGYPLVLGEDEYFVMGDNRGNSRDSRNYGAVSAEQLEGRLLCIAFRWEG